MTEVEERIFYSTGLSYTLKWVKSRHNNIIPKHLGNRLLNYYNFLCSNNYPDHIFKDPKITRCSNFKVKHLKRNARKNISLELIKLGLVDFINKQTQPEKYPKSILKIPQMASIWFDIYQMQSNSSNSPGHDPILGKILEINEAALATEVSVWSTTPESLRDGILEKTPYTCSARELFTGHIDLLLYDKEKVDEFHDIALRDQKPENGFLKSLPQVAIYGLMMKKILNIDRLKCMSFSRRKAWIYDPEIIRKEIMEYIRMNGDPKLSWRWILTGI